MEIEFVKKIKIEYVMKSGCGFIQEMNQPWAENFNNKIIIIIIIIRWKFK